MRPPSKEGTQASLQNWISFPLLAIQVELSYTSLRADRIDLHVKLELGGILAFHIDVLGKYLPLSTLVAKEVGFVTNLQTCLARSAKLKELRSLIPTPPASKDYLVNVS